MKKLFTLLTATFFGVASFAQCTPDFTNTTTGLTPSSDMLACAEQGVAYNQTIQIYAPASVTVPGIPIPITITSVRVDSIANLPCGLQYGFDQLDHTYIGGDKGCMQLSGTTSDAVGQYKLKVYVTLVTSLVSGSYEASTIPGIGAAFNVFVRVKAAGGTCAAIDTSAGAVNKISTCANVDYTNVPTLENELVKFNVTPMPANDNLNITFSASENNSYNYTISNMVGATVYTNSVDAVAGENKLAVDVSNLTNGVYFLNINRGDASLTKKIIISH
jgi:hypothetical protein